MNSEQRQEYMIRKAQKLHAETVVRRRLNSIMQWWGIGVCWFAAGLLMTFQDVLGKERYLEWISNWWVNTPMWVSLTVGLAGIAGMVIAVSKGKRILKGISYVDR